MKVRHLRPVFFHSKLFVMRNGAKMLARTFCGVTLKTLFGLEDERTAFARYCTIREAERVYL